MTVQEGAPTKILCETTPRYAGRIFFQNIGIFQNSPKLIYVQSDPEVDSASEALP